MRRRIERLAAAAARPEIRRALVLAGLHVLLVWTVAAAVIWQNQRSLTADDDRIGRQVGAAIATSLSGALDSGRLLGREAARWLAEQDPRSADQFARLVRDERFLRLVKQDLRVLPDIGGLVAIGSEGNLIAAIGDTPAAAALPWPEIVPHPDAEISSPPLLSPSRAMGGRSQFFLLQEVSSRQAVRLGFIAVAFDADRIAGTMKAMAGTAAATVTLLRADGTPLASTAGAADGAAGIPASLSDSALAVAGYPALLTVESARSGLAESSGTIVVIVVAVLLTAVIAVWSVRILDLVDQATLAKNAASDRGLLAAIVETPSALTAIVDARGRVVRSNARFSAMLRDHSPGGRGYDLRAAEPFRKVIEFIEGGRPTAEMDLELERAGGHSRLLHFSLSRHFLPRVGECLIMVGHDETERQQIKQALAQSAKLVTLGEMTTGIAHELSQPLNVIRMSAQNALGELVPEGTDAAAEPVLPADATEAEAFVAGKLQKIVLQVDRAAAIIARMRIFGRPSNEPPAVYDVRGACTAALAMIGDQLRAGRIRIRQDLGSEPLQTFGHAGLLQQVLVLLLINARDALRDTSGPDKVIDLRAFLREDGHVILQVGDNGPGVPEEIRDRIFEPFFTAKSPGKGTGLGLTMAFGIVRDAGGTLTLLPTAEGATFQVALGAARPA